MRTDAELRRLAEMGVDVYVPRRDDSARPASSDAGTVDAPAAGTQVWLLADDDAHPLLAAIVHSLAFAGLSATAARAADGAALAGARALVVFGAQQARSVGAQLSARQQARLGWVALDAPQGLCGNVLAKRALWSELKRLQRQLARGAASAHA